MTPAVKKFIEDFIGLIDNVTDKNLNSLIHHANAELNYWECVELREILEDIEINLEPQKLIYIQEDIRERILDLTPSIGESFTCEDLYPESITDSYYSVFDCIMEDLREIVISNPNFLCGQFRVIGINADLGYIQFTRIK